MRLRRDGFRTDGRGRGPRARSGFPPWGRGPGAECRGKTRGRRENHEGLRAPIAAATLGGWFLGLGIFAASLARAARWSAARLAVPMIALGATFLLLATLLHWPAFNWNSPPAWIWLILYIGAPPGFLAIYVVKERAAAPAIPARPALAGPLRAILTGAAAAYGACGVVLFVWPALLLPFWPWPLLPLGARVYAAFVLAYAAGAWLVSRAGAGQAAAMPLYPFAMFPLLAFAIPWLHIDTFHLATPGGALYLLLTGGLGSVLIWAIRAGPTGQPLRTAGS